MRLLRYAVVGAIGTVAHYALLIALVQAASLVPLLVTTVGAIVGAIVNYALNYQLTFESRRAHRHALPRFAAVALGGTVVNGVLFAILYHRFGLHYLVAQAAATLVVLGITYLANRAWTF